MWSAGWTLHPGVRLHMGTSTEEIPMSSRVRDVLMQRLPEMRHEPTTKRVRAQLDGRAVVDSTRAVLVWEPRRVVPTYAVPAEDVHAQIVAAPERAHQADPSSGFASDFARVPVLDPRIPFDVHTAEGEPVEIRVDGSERDVAGFRPSDPELSGLVVLDFAGFDTWLEEDDEIVSHPHDPYSRIDVRRTSRHIELRLDGQKLADTTRASMVFETMLPVRYYIPREDVVAKLTPSPTVTYCAYKGKASYWSADVGGRTETDLAWTYEDPLDDVAMLPGYVAFFDERVDVVVDGVGRERPVTPWS